MPVLSVDTDGGWCCVHQKRTIANRDDGKFAPILPVAFAYTPARGEFRLLTDLQAHLKTETAGVHHRVRALPFFQALHAGDLPALAIVNFERCLAVIHAVLERELAKVSGGPVAEFGGLASPKVPLLVADLEALGAEGVPSITDAIQGALECGAEVLARAENPLSLVGTLYVMEGSQNGGLALRHAYARCLARPESEISYFGCYGNGTAARWTTFGERLNALVPDRRRGEGGHAFGGRLFRAAREDLRGALPVCRSTPHVSRGRHQRRGRGSRHAAGPA